MSSEFGFGIIGSGMIAGFHSRAIAEIDGCRLAAVLSPTPGKAAAFAARWDANGYETMEAFLADPGIDAVIVATPSGMHMEGALAAIAAGKHVLIEKPLEITAERCDRIIRAAAAKGVTLGGVFNSRYLAVPRLIKEAADAGRFGTIAIADAQVKWYRSQEYYDSGSWRGTWALDGGGALMNQSIHAVDLLQWFMGPVAEISGRIAVRSHERIEVEDTAVASLTFQNGALGMIEGTTSAWPGFLKRIEICGSRGSVIMEEESLKVWQFMDETAADEDIRQRYAADSASSGGAADPSAISHEGHRLEIAEFAEAARTGRPFPLDGAEARKAVEIIEGIYRSARTGGPVTLPLPPESAAAAPQEED